MLLARPDHGSVALAPGRVAIVILAVAEHSRADVRRERGQRLADQPVQTLDLPSAGLHLRLDVRLWGAGFRHAGDHRIPGQTSRACASLERPGEHTLLERRVLARQPALRGAAPAEGAQAALPVLGVEVRQGAEAA